MKIDASAPREGGSSARCWRLELRPDDDHEADLLARLYRVLMFGGQVQIRQGGVDPFVVTFPGDGKETA